MTITTESRTRLKATIKAAAGPVTLRLHGGDTITGQATFSTENLTGEILTVADGNIRWTVPMEVVAAVGTST